MSVLDTASGGTSWWLESGAFKSLGFGGSLALSDSHYLGGWSGHTTTYTGKVNTKIMKVDQSGISLRGFKTIFTIPWSDVVELEVDGPDVASKRVTAGRALLLGPFALAAKKTSKSAVLIVRTRSGDEALFATEKMTAGELRTKLLPLISKMRHSNTSASASPQRTPQAEVGLDMPQFSVADELAKLAQLRADGILTDEEFGAQKALLLR